MKKKEKMEEPKMLKQSVNPEFSGKRIILIVLMILLASTFAFADYRITRGPDVGEIYFVGPTATGEGIYRSTDFGKTAVCMDSITPVISICADKTPGVLYYDYFDNLFVSYNYGQYGSWIFRNSNTSYKLKSGVSEGFLYNGFWKHSEDYGLSFIQHSYNGYFGSFSTSEIDNDQNIGYVKSHSTSNPDSIFFFVSYDNFENLELQNVFSYSEKPIGNLTRGFYSGELYTVGGDWATLMYSNNFGSSWELKNTLYFNNVADAGIVGGRQPGELYVLATYTQLMHEIAHIYIYHSLDYGESFTVYHPFSHGPEPYIANFEASPISGTAPLTVQFTDLSTGESIYYWEWDFDNDGVIDSYEQNPEYTYQDTGYYSVKLKIQCWPDYDEIIKEDYIYISEGNAINEELPTYYGLNLENSPNPFNLLTSIRFYTKPNKLNGLTLLKIYNIKGVLIKKLRITNYELPITNYQLDCNGLSSGVYLYKLEGLYNSKIKKMILIK